MLHAVFCCALAVLSCCWVELQNYPERKKTLEVMLCDFMCARLTGVGVIFVNMLEMSRAIL